MEGKGHSKLRNSNKKYAFIGNLEGHGLFQNITL
jgi:hypothetical protein